VKALSWIGWEQGQPIYHPRISKGIEKAQKKVEQRNFEARKSLLEYDEVMDYQRKIFYSRRRKILEGKGLKAIIEEMIESVLEKNCRTMLSDKYPYSCAVEWLRSNLGIDLTPSDIKGANAEEIEELAKAEAKKNAANNISLSLGEYLEDYQDRSTWDLQGLCKWAMSSFSVSLSPGKLKHAEPEEIEEQLISAAEEQIDKKDCSPLFGFLKEDFGLRSFAEWARAKFGISLGPEDLKGQRPEQIQQRLSKTIKAKYHQREIEYPVEFAMNMAYGPEGANIYGFEALAKWANRKFNAGLAAEQFQHSTPRAIHKQLLELSESFNNGQLIEEITDKVNKLEPAGLAHWARERFETNLEEDELSGPDRARARLAEVGAEFLREELSELEKYILVQIYDAAWKEHLYGMDHLKEGVFLRAWAERDPKVEYKHEGYRMFTEMLETIEERVTDIIFKVRLEAGSRAKNVWQVSSARHDEVNQFAMAERQRAAAAAPQGETKVKQIKLEQPKVGRNDPCPCGSGKKYKKCCGAKS
jgi:preprotein translocase subunit SecA